MGRRGLSQLAVALLSCLEAVKGAAFLPLDATIIRQDNSSVAPLGDQFYDLPSNLSAYNNGDVIRMREIISVFNGSSAIQLFYKTTDQFNNSDGTVTTVFPPTNPASPPRIVSYQVPEDATNLNCAPSYAYVNGSNSPDPYVATSEGGFLFDFAAQQNAYLVSSDFEGSKSAWLVGLIEAHGVLDGIRAAINHYSLSNASVTMYGFSGGAHATTWASEQAASYAPELQIVGTAAGGIPIDNTAGFTKLDGTLYAGLAMAGIVGLANGYPELNTSLYEHATANGTIALQKFQQPDFCAIGKIGDFAGQDIINYFTPNTYLLSDPLTAIGKNESLLMNVSTIGVPVPTFPRYIFHSMADDIVPFAPDAQYVEQQCNGTSANIIFVQYPTGSHVVTETNGREPALGFLAAAFSNTLPTVSCGGNYTFT